ncbi:MAG: sugar phosphate isomerase/epimerase family protein [Chloroflexota bacterium]
MEFACHTWGFNDRPLPEALGTIARLGFRYVDLGTGPHIDVGAVARDPRARATELRQLLTAFNLKLSDVYVMLPRITLRDEGRRRKEIDLFKSMLPFLVALEAPGVTLSPGLKFPDEDTADLMDRSVAALREMVAAARAATPATRLRVSIEPHMDSVGQSPEDALKIVRQVKDLEITLDWAHMICQDAFSERITPLLAHTRHVQVRQAARAQLQLPLERGRIDMAQLVSTLRDAAYDGMVCVEIMQTIGWHGTEPVDTVTEAARLRDALRDARDGITT